MIDDTMALPPIPTIAVIELIASGVLYTIAAAIIQRKLVNPKRTRQLQDQIKLKSDEVRKLIKDNAPKEQIAEKQKEMMPLMKASMGSSMKAMFVLLPSFLVVYYLIIPFAFGYLGTATTQLNLFSHVFYLQYRGVFFVTVFVLGLITSIGILIYDRYRAKKDVKKEEAQEGIAEQPL